MDKLPEATKNELRSIFEKLMADTSKSASDLTIDDLINSKKPLTVELFSQNIEEYIFFMVAQRVTTSFSTRLGKVIEKISEVLVKAQGGKIINKPKPYDLKFKLEDSVEYWIEIKSINGQNSSNRQTILERKTSAEKKGKIFRLCMYNDDNKSDEEYKLNGDEFWTLIAGFKNAKTEVYKLINGAAKNISISSIVNETKDRLIVELEKSGHLIK